MEQKKEKIYRIYPNIRQKIKIFNLSLQFFLCYFFVFLICFVSSVFGYGNGKLTIILKMAFCLGFYFLLLYISRNKHKIFIFKGEKFPDQIDFDTKKF